ncbi:Rtc1 [Nucleospora cyclopteri]
MIETEFILQISSSILQQKTVEIDIKTQKEDKKEVLDFLKEFNGSNWEIKEDKIIFRPGFLKQEKMRIKTGEIVNVAKILLLIGPFFDQQIEVLIEGVTNKEEPLDALKISFWVLYKHLKWTNPSGFNIEIQKRGFEPHGGGIAKITVKKANKIPRIQLTEPEKTEKIRGLVISSRIGADFSFRMIKTIKKLSAYKNTKIMSVISGRADSGISPGFACAIFAESKNSFFYSYKQGNSSISPEELAEGCFKELEMSQKEEFLLDEKILPFLFFFASLSNSLCLIAVKNPNLLILECLKKCLNIKYSITEEKQIKIIKILGNKKIIY